MRVKLIHDGQNRDYTEAPFVVTKVLFELIFDENSQSEHSRSLCAFRGIRPVAGLYITGDLLWGR
ncbi:hypothetical protein J3R74_003775 [Puniceicoccus vermicola]